MSTDWHDQPVGTRLVIMLPGFEPVPSQAHYRRFCREAAQTASVFGMRFACSEPRSEDGGCGVSTFTVDASGEGWRTSTDVVFYDLARLNAVYGDRSVPGRLLGGFAGVFDILLSGAPCRYLRDGWRFLLFFLAPFCLLAAATLLVALAVLPPLLDGIRHLAWSLPLALLGAAALVVVGKRKDILLMMDLWALTADVARGRRPEVQEILDAVQGDVAARIAASDAEEVVVVGHSFGVVPAVMALADERVLASAHQRYVGLLALGSYLLAVAHHPAAKGLREAAGRVLAEPVVWIDVQAMTDPINFFGTNPADVLDSATPRRFGRPLMLIVRFRDLLSSESYHRLRGDVFRTHRQFIYGVERRTGFALFAMIAGPERFGDIAPRGGLLPDWARYAEAAKAGE